MRITLKIISDVTENQLCTGCGACAYAEPNTYTMVDTLHYGRRPVLVDNPAQENGLALKACPGASLEHNVLDDYDSEVKSDYFNEWGPILAVWEGYANDQQLRFAGSSGGAATALSLFCVEKLDMAGVLHTEMDAERPYLNKTAFSVNREQLMTRAGSRYSPASPCEGLSQLENLDKPSVFVGKPCDVAAVGKLRKINAKLDSKIGVTIGFFCAGTPSLEGLFALLKQHGIDDPAQLKKLRFRGNGWPGLWTADYVDAQNQQLSSVKLTYAESWGFLQKYRQWRCYICPDHTGEFADIAVGDPWYRQVEQGESGKSLIIARTRKGLEIIQAAANAGYITLETKDDTLLPKSQPNLLNTRGILWARLMTLKVFGVPIPRYIGFPMFSTWLFKVKLIDKVRSITGTVKRIYTKRLRHRVSISAWKI
jgi:coenzyme F420 hydrogenase subunit beta